MSHIQMFKRDTEEGFKEWLESKGHTVDYITTDHTVVDGVPVSVDESKRQYMDFLWNAFTAEQ